MSGLRSMCCPVLLNWSWNPDTCPTYVVSISLTLIKSLQHCSVCSVSVFVLRGGCEPGGRGRWWEVTHVIVESMGTRVRQNKVNPGPVADKLWDHRQLCCNFIKSFCHLLNGDCASTLSKITRTQPPCFGSLEEFKCCPWPQIACLPLWPLAQWQSL